MIQSVSFESRVVTIGALVHYATIFDRVQIDTKSRRIDLYDDEPRKTKIEVRLCKYCNKVELKPKQQSFCSNSHASRYKIMMGIGNAVARTIRPDINCQYCNNVFSPGTDTSKFCTKECKDLSQKKPLRECSHPECSTMFHPRKPTTLFCSRNCAYDARRFK